MNFGMHLFTYFTFTLYSFSIVLQIIEINKKNQTKTLSVLNSYRWIYCNIYFAVFTLLPFIYCAVELVIPSNRLLRIVNNFKQSSNMTLIA